EVDGRGALVDERRALARTATVAAVADRAVLQVQRMQVAWCGCRAPGCLDTWAQESHPGEPEGESNQHETSARGAPLPVGPADRSDRSGRRPRPEPFRPVRSQTWSPAALTTASSVRSASWGRCAS